MFLGAAMLLAIGALSRQNERPFSASLVYLALGLAATVIIHGLGVSWIDPFDNSGLVKHVAEFALLVALFGTGLRIERALTIRAWKAVLVLIALVMPATIALVAVWGVLGMGLSLGAAIALGAILAPTDPVLAGDVGVGAPGEEQRGDARFNLSGEAALNDSLASPFVLLGVFVLEEEGSGWIGEWLLTDVAYAVLVGAALGAAAGYGIAALADLMRRRDLLSGELDGFLIIGAVLLIYGATDAIDAYGLLAVFAAGVAFRRYEFGHERNRRVHDGAEVATNFLELAVILMLGSIVTLTGLEQPGLTGWLLAPLLLLVIRPATVMILLSGSSMAFRERAFVGWLGVRGIATIYYAAFVIEEGVLSKGEGGTVFWTVTICVIVSIALHGITQNLATRRLLR